MVSRYFLLSGIPLNRLTICDEIQNMMSYLVENLRSANSNSISEEGKEKLLTFFFLYLIKMTIFCYKYYSIPFKCKF